MAIKTKLPLKKKILIVEDVYEFQQILSDKLMDEGYSVFIAGNGNDGIEVAQSINPDLIITDLMMPGMSGSKMINEIRKTDWGGNIPVIVLSNANLDKKTRLDFNQQSKLTFREKASTSIKQLLELVSSYVGAPQSVAA